jgi:outer membrane protein OmpA-like peptidoglycan-associated protein
MKSPARSVLVAALLMAARAQAEPFDKGGINGVGARAWGMGGAVVAQDGDGDASSLWWNPASLYLSKGYDLSYQNGSLLGGSSQDNSLSHSGVLPQWDLAYGLAYRILDTADAPHFRQQTTLVSLALPFNNDKSLLFGFNTKFYSSQLEVPGGEADGYGIDFGFLYSLPQPLQGLRLGLQVQDFQNDLEWSDGRKENPPQLMQGGLSWAVDAATRLELDGELVTDYSQSSRSSEGFRAGAERRFALKLKNFQSDDFFSLRLGYMQSSALAPTSLGGFFTAGAGFDIYGVHLDYAFLQDVNGLGKTNRASLSYFFQPLPVPTPKPRPTRTPAPLAPPVVLVSPTPSPAPAQAAFSLEPDVDVFAPLAQSRRSVVNFAVGGLPADLSGYTLSITRSGDPKPLRTLRGKRVPSSLRWDGRNSQAERVPDGNYVATLRVLSASSGLRSIQAKVAVDTRRPKLSLEAYPHIFSPGDGERPVVIEAKADRAAGIPLRWELLVENLAGKAVKRFEGKGLAPEKIQWAGLADDGQKLPAESLYYLSYSVEMESGALARTARLSMGSEVSAFTAQSAIKVTLTTIKFAPDDEVVKLEDYRSLKEAADGVKKYGTEYLVQVLGYSDSQEAKAGAVGALELSFLRAKAVREYLVESGGLDPERVKSMGFGSERPMGDDATEAGRARNRRVEVVLYTK